jgi:hypothetical protein
MIIKTKKLSVLKTWLIGGQIDPMGGCGEGFHFLNNLEQAIENGIFLSETKTIDKIKLRENIEFAIEEYGNETYGFKYYGDKYKFALPCDKNLKILTNRISKELTKKFIDYINN